MATVNDLLTPTVIAKEALMQLTNHLAMSRHVYTAYKNEFVKVGNSITIRKPNKFRATDGAGTRDNTNIEETSTTISMATQSHVSWAFSSQELTTTIEDYSKRYISPACNALANSVDAALCGLYKDVYNYAGTPGTTPNAFSMLGDAQQALDDEAAPSDMRIGVMSPAANWSLADALKGTFAMKPANDLYTKGFLGQVANLNIYSDQNVVRHTNGGFAGGTPLVKTTITAEASAVVADGCDNADTIEEGDIFTIAGVYAVNPMSGASTGVLRRFTVTADVDAVASVDRTIPLSPKIIVTGAYQTVDAYPVDGAAITFIGTASTAYPQNLIFHPNAFALVTVPIEMPANVWGARETDKDAGLSIRVVKQYDIDVDEEIIRLDILYGMKTLYPELACRLWGK